MLTENPRHNLTMVFVFYNVLVFLLITNWLRIISNMLLIMEYRHMVLVWTKALVFQRAHGDVL